MSQRHHALGLLVLGLAMPLRADEAPTPADAPPGPAAEPFALPHPLTELRQAYEARLAGLQQSYAATTEPALALELQRQIRRTKLGFEADFLSLQLERALQSGKSDECDELRATIELLHALMRDPAPEAPRAPAPDGAQ